MSRCFQTCATCPVQGQSLFAGLDPVQTESLAKAKTLRTYKNREAVFSQGSPVDGIYCIGAGAVKVLQKSKKGKASLVRLASAGDTVGHRSIFTQEKFLGSAKTIEPGTHLCFIPKSHLHSLLNQSHGFSLRLIQRISRDLEITELNQLALREKNVRERLAGLLMRLKDAHGRPETDGSWTIELTVSKADLAAMLGVADETVIRAMSDFREEGLVRSVGKRIGLLRWREIAALADYP